MISKRAHDQPGFALTELLIVIVILVVMSLGSLIVYDKAKHTNSSGVKSQSVSQSGKSSSSDKILDFSHQNIAKVGSSIYNQTDATQLILSYNNLTSLPSQLGNMSKLQVLRVDHNRLQGALIAEVRKMPLVTLDASYNEMTGIPAEIGQLNQLQTLNYSYNNIGTLPKEIANLKQLKTLDLTGNPLSNSQIAQLKSDLPNTAIIF